MDARIILSELSFKAVRSSGPGGQHVNKTSSKVEVQFDVRASEGLTAEEKERLQLKLANRISSQGILSLQSGESRSQHRNKRAVIDRLLELIEQHLKKEKPRKKTKPGKAAVEKRLREKKHRSQKKHDRKPPLDY
ncbi:MAG: alternative ribosome rescue aminoacyl-tRNA hydrolase ArfB [Bacteroidota bacterium]